MYIHIVKRILFIIRLLLGPLPLWLCEIRLFLLLAYACYQILLTDEIFLFSYLYICVWKTVGSINEDFVQKVLVIVNPTISLYFSGMIIHRGSYGNFHHYQFCTGINASGEPCVCQVSSKRNHSLNILMLLSILFCSLMLCCIWRRVRRRTNQVMTLNQNSAVTEQFQNETLDILKIAKIRLLVTVLNYMTNLIMPLLTRRHGLENLPEILTKQLRIMSSILPLIYMSVLFPLLSIYCRESLKKKFKKLLQRVLHVTRIYQVNV